MHKPDIRGPGSCRRRAVSDTQRATANTHIPPPWTIYVPVPNPTAPEHTLDSRLQQEDYRWQNLFDAQASEAWKYATSVQDLRQT